MQRRDSLGTFGHLRRPSGILGNHRKHSVNPRQLSETVGNLHVYRFLYVLVTKSVKFGRTEVSIPPINAKFQDLSIQRVVKGCFLIFSCEKSIFHPFFGRIVEEKMRFSSRNRSGRGFMSSRLVGMTAWVSGLRKSRFWPKILRKTKENQRFSSVFPLVGLEA